MAETRLEVLFSILRQHDVVFDRDAIETAFNDPENQTAIQDWMDEQLGTNTLLSKEEAVLYAALMKSGEAQSISASQDLSIVQGLSDLEIHDAVEELKRSTAAIEKQTEALKLQQNAMSTLVKNNTHIGKVRAQADDNQHRRWEVEKAQISTAVEELSESLAYQTADLEQQLRTSQSSVKQTIDGILKSDDKLLLSLQKLASDLDHGHSEEDHLLSKLRELCARLIKHTVEGVRTKLDRIYLEALNGSADTNSDSSDHPETADLQEELESLYSEILPVAQMSVEQQYLEPALREVQAREGQGRERSEKAVKYIHNCLLFLVNRIGLFLERAEEHRCHQAALSVVVEKAKKELQPVEEPSPAKAVRPSQPSRKASTSQSAVKRRDTRRRSSGLFDDDTEIEQQLLRTLGISLPAEVNSDEARADILQRALSERMNKLGGHSDNLQMATESSISSYLRDAHITMQLLRDTLLADSPYGKVQLLDQDTESAISTLEQEVENLQATLEKVDLRHLQARNVHRDELIERWSR